MSEDTVTLTSKQYHDLVTALEYEKGAYNALVKDCVPMSVIEDIETEINEGIESYKHKDKAVMFGFMCALYIINKHVEGWEE